MGLKLNKVGNAKNLEVTLFMRYVKQAFIRCMIMQQGFWGEKGGGGGVCLGFGVESWEQDTFCYDKLNPYASSPINPSANVSCMTQTQVIR